MKYMELTTKQVEAAIADVLPSKFALIFDGWTCEESMTHYLAVCTSFIGKNNEVRTALLAFTPFEDESTFTATAHQDELESILEVFGKTLDNVVCLVGDNCPVNQKLATDCELPLVGCAAHRFNLEVQAYLDQYSPLLQRVCFLFCSGLTQHQVHDLMTKAKTSKVIGALRQDTKLVPKTKSVTRWTGSFSMVRRLVSAFSSLIV